MDKNTNAERRTSNVERRMRRVDFDSTFEVRRSAFGVRLLLILSTGLFIYGFRLGDSPLDRTEPFRALVADQMVHTGNWLIPRLYGEVYLRKPPLIYWIQAGVEKLAGEGNEFIWRLPSAVGYALFAVFLAWWSARWFGLRALFPTGFACLALIALWDQNRGADIDALNTVSACITTVCVLELICGLGTGRAGWSLGLGLSLGGTLLLKGPGGLPQILAAIIGPTIVLGNWRPLRKPAVWIGLLIGFANFAIYIAAAKSAMSHLGIAADHSGSQEVVDKVFLPGWKKRAAALFTPVLLLLYALPVSLILPLSLFTITHRTRGDLYRNRAKAILGTLVVACTIWFLGSNDNPRYEYVMLPLLAPLVGFVWASSAMWDPRRMLIPVCVLITGTYLLLTLKLPTNIPDHRLVWIGAAASYLLCIIWLVIPRSPSGRWTDLPIVLLLILLAIPMAERKNAERRRKSAENAAGELRRVIGNAATVASVGVVRDMPELFYYAGLNVISFGEAGLPALAEKAKGQWVVISETDQYPAYSTLLKQIPEAFPGGLKKLHMPDPRDHIYVGYYNPPPGTDVKILWNPHPPKDSEE